MSTIGSGLSGGQPPTAAEPERADSQQTLAEALAGKNGQLVVLISRIPGTSGKSWHGYYRFEAGVLDSELPRQSGDGFALPISRRAVFDTTRGQYAVEIDDQPIVVAANHVRSSEILPWFEAGGRGKLFEVAAWEVLVGEDAINFHRARSADVEFYGIRDTIDALAKS